MSEPNVNGAGPAGGGASHHLGRDGRDGQCGAPASGHVLLLDTNVGYSATLADALDRFGIGISWRGRILGLFDALAECDPIALVMGAELPGSDPLDLIRSVRGSRWFELPIFVIVDEPDRSLELRAYVEGADSVLMRDGSTGELAAHIMGHARRRMRRRKNVGRELADMALALCEEHVAQPLESPASETTRAALDDITHVRLEGVSVDLAPLPNDLMATEAVVASVPPALAKVPVSEAAIPDVILVDDDPSLLEMLRYVMMNRGYKTLSLSNGLDALRTLSELDTGGRRPVVLLDVDLPGLDGFRILHELSNCRPGDYQIILCTVHSSEATQVLGIQSGAVDYIVKPFRMPIVLAKVERLLGPAGVHAGA